MKKEIKKVVAIRYSCPFCKREHMMGCRGDWFEIPTRYCRWDGAELWHELIKKEQKAYAEPEQAEGS